MREALAAADHDYILAEPASKPKRPRAKTAAKRRGSSRRNVQTRRYVTVIASALCVAVIAGIAINALTLQKRRHPAPLFARAAPAPAMKEPAVAESSLAAPIPVPAPRPQPEAPAAAQPNEKAAEKAQIEPPEKPVHSHQAPAGQNADAAEARQQDPISQLLQSNAHEPQSTAAAGPSKTVLVAQRALIKLGFVLRADGVAGATTRQAIERYERDHKLPPHGELTPALLRRLSAEAAIPIE